jgi:hypothetical protein
VWYSVIASSHAVALFSLATVWQLDWSAEGRSLQQLERPLQPLPLPLPPLPLELELQAIAAAPKTTVNKPIANAVVNDFMPGTPRKSSWTVDGRRASRRAVPLTE